MNPVDALWLTADQPENLMVVEALVMLAGPVDRARVEQVVQQRVVDRFPVFARRPAPARRPGGRARWVPAEGFAVADHVREVTLPAPVDDAALQDYIGGHLHAPLPADRPLWEIRLLTGHPTGTAVYVRLHHALADGIALTEVLLSITDADPDADPADVPDLRARAVSAAPGPPDGAGAPLARRARTAARGARRAATVPGVLAKLLTTRCPTTSLSGVAGRTKRVVWAAPVPLAAVKGVAAATGSTVNDVLVAALAGAVRRYLHHHDGAAVDVPTMVPVDLRPADQPLAAELGNRFAVVVLALPSGLRTPLARLAETKRRMDAIKGSLEPAVTFTLMHGIGRTGRRLGRLLTRYFAGKAVGVTTNVPGPREPRYLAGTRIERLLGWVPGTGHQTLGTCIFSYAGDVFVGFKVDAAVVPDPARIAEAFADEVDALVRSTAA